MIINKKESSLTKKTVKAPKRPPLSVKGFLDRLVATGLTVVHMTEKDLQLQLEGHIKDLHPASGLNGFDIYPENGKDNIHQLLVVYDEDMVDAVGRNIDKRVVCIKLFDKVMNLTTFDPNQIKIGTSYVTRSNYRLNDDRDMLSVFSSSVMESVMAYRKLLGDPKLVRH